MPVCEVGVEKKRPVIIICSECYKEVLSTLEVNATAKVLKTILLIVRETEETLSKILKHLSKSLNISIRRNSLEATKDFCFLELALLSDQKSIFY